MAEIKDFLKRVQYSQGPGEVEGSCILVIDDLGGGYTRDQDFTVKIAGEQKEFFVSKLRNRMSAADDSRGQVITGVSLIAKKVKESPGKRLVFATMSRAELDVWNEEFGDTAASLEFLPLNRLGNVYGERGWTAHQIAQVLATYAGITLQVSLPKLDVKRYEVEEDTSYLNAIVGLWHDFNPVLDSVGGVVFLLDPEYLDGTFIPNNTLAIDKPELADYEETREDKPSQIKVTGTLGRFRPKRHKGPISPHPYQWKKFYAGDLWVKGFAYGFKVEVAPRELNRWSRGGVIYWIYDKVTTARGNDIFGKPNHLILENRERWLASSGPVGDRLISRQATVYDLRDSTHFMFERPVEYGRVSSLAAELYWPAREFGQNVLKFGTVTYETRRTTYRYDGRGILVGQDTATYGLVYVLDGEYQPLKQVSDVEGAEMSAEGVSEWMLIELETVAYSQMSRDSYIVTRDINRRERDGRWSTDSDIQSIQGGGPQQSPIQYRMMPVYAEDGVVSGPMSTPASLARVETPSWEAVEAALPRIKRQRGSDKFTAVFNVHGELNVQKGTPVTLTNIVGWDGATMTLPALDPTFTPRVVGFSIDQDLYAGTAMTTITVEGKLL